jgi:hypothetical protein
MIAQTIQLALAPVFVLVAMGNIMNLLSTRLGRVVDRARFLQDRYTETKDGEHDDVVVEMRLVDRRMKLIEKALLLLVMSGVTVAFTVGLLFLEEVAHVEISQVAAGGFLLAIALLMCALLLFLYETRIAAKALHIHPDYLELERKL